MKFELLGYHLFENDKLIYQPIDEELSYEDKISTLKDLSDTIEVHKIRFKFIFDDISIILVYDKIKNIITQFPLYMEKYNGNFHKDDISNEQNNLKRQKLLSRYISVIRMNKTPYYFSESKTDKRLKQFFNNHLQK